MFVLAASILVPSTCFFCVHYMNDHNFCLQLIVIMIHPSGFPTLYLFTIDLIKMPKLLCTQIIESFREIYEDVKQQVYIPSRFFRFNIFLIVSCRTLYTFNKHNAIEADSGLMSTTQILIYRLCCSVLSLLSFVSFESEMLETIKSLNEKHAPNGIYRSNCAVI